LTVPSMSVQRTAAILGSFCQPAIISSKSNDCNQSPESALNTVGVQQKR
jgi:hypothetical protein